MIKELLFSGDRKLEEASMQDHSINWYNNTGEQFVRLQPNDVVQLEVWDGDTHVWHAIRVLRPPARRRLNHRSIDTGIFGRDRWAEGTLLLSELVFNHAPMGQQAADWQPHPCHKPGDSSTPVVIAYLLADHPNLPCARMWWGEPGQELDTLYQEVLAALPDQPLVTPVTKE